MKCLKHSRVPWNSHTQQHSNAMICLLSEEQTTTSLIVSQRRTSAERTAGSTGRLARQERKINYESTRIISHRLYCTYGNLGRGRFNASELIKIVLIGLGQGTISKSTGASVKPLKSNPGLTVHPTNVQSPVVSAACHQSFSTIPCGRWPAKISGPSWIS